MNTSSPVDKHLLFIANTYHQHQFKIEGRSRMRSNFNMVFSFLSHLKHDGFIMYVSMYTNQKLHDNHANIISDAIDDDQLIHLHYPLQQNSLLFVVLSQSKWENENHSSHSELIDCLLH